MCVLNHDPVARYFPPLSGDSPVPWPALAEFPMETSPSVETEPHSEPDVAVPAPSDTQAVVERAPTLAAVLQGTETTPRYYI